MFSIGEKLNWRGVLGMIIDVRGGLVFFGTPHHSLMKIGLFHFDANPLSEDEKITLAGFEYEADLLGITYPKNNDLDKYLLGE